MAKLQIETPPVAVTPGLNKVKTSTPWTDAMKTLGGRWERPVIPAALGYPASIGSVWTGWDKNKKDDDDKDRNDLVNTITNPTLTGGGGGHNSGPPGTSVATTTGDHWKNTTSTNDWNTGVTTTNGKVTSNPTTAPTGGLNWKKTGWKDHR